MRSNVLKSRPTNVPYSAGIVLLMLVVSAGCIEREGRPVNPCTNVTIGQEISVTNVDQVDLLFMVDNSNSMMQEQASLTREFPTLVNILASGDFNQDGDQDDDEDFEPVRDLNIGVITSDMGTGGFSVPTCLRSDFGDDGILRTEGRADIAGCMAVYPSFLNFRPEQGGDPNQFATDVGCVATVGTGGCGFEQQLEALLKGASPSAPTAWTSDDFQAPTFFRNTFGHADRGNDGFIRDGSVLALVPVTDEEDCSARPEEVELFNQDSTIYTAELNLRCFAHSEQALHTIDRYVDGFINLRRRPGLLIYAPIVGIPTDLVPAAGERPDYPRLIGPPGTRDPRMLQEVMTPPGDQLVPSCNVPGRGVAFPPIRIVQVAEQLQNRDAGVTVQSICQESFQGALREIINQIKSALGQACLPRALNVQADGSVNCDVLAVMPSGMPCSALDGAVQRMVDGVPEVRGDREVCVVDQQVGAGGEAPTAAGWYYDNFTAEVMTNCVDTPQRIAFTVQPPSGADIELQCFQSVNQVGEGDITVGTFCEPESGGDAFCGGGNDPAGLNPLSCDPILRTCGVPCETDAGCRAAGLVGFVCDTRPRNEVDMSSTDTTPYNQCINPTC